MPSSPVAVLVDSVLRDAGSCARRCDASAIVLVLSELGADDVDALRVLLLHCRAELTARLSGVAPLVFIAQLAERLVPCTVPCADAELLREVRAVRRSLRRRLRPRPARQRPASAEGGHWAMAVH